MDYNLERQMIKANQNDKKYNLVKDVLKDKKFIYSTIPSINYYGLLGNDTKNTIYADIYARYYRLKGYNVLYRLGIDKLTYDGYVLSKLSHQTLNEFMSKNDKTYLNDIIELDTSVPQNELLENDKDYMNGFVQSFFKALYEKNYIKSSNDDYYFSSNRMYQESEVFLLNNEAFSYDYKKLTKRNGHQFYVDLSGLKREIIDEIDSLPLDKKHLKEVQRRFGYYYGINLTLKTTLDKDLTITIKKPELLFGISYLVINPYLFDLSNYLTDFDIETLDVLKYQYAGFDIINYFNNYHIPVYLSKAHDMPVYLGIPSFCEEDEVFSQEYKLPYLPIFDYVDDNRILVNSLFLNGYSEEEARNVMIEHIENMELGKRYKDISLKKLNITSLYNYGIPFPLNRDKTFARIPLIYDQEEGKYLDPEVNEKMIYKYFFAPPFIKATMINALRLYDDFEVLLPDNQYGKRRASDFNVIEKMCLNFDYADELFWFIIINVLFKHCYGNEAYLKVKDITITDKLKDSLGQDFTRQNNNLISLDNILEEYGSTYLRLYYVKNMNNNIFDINSLPKMSDEIEHISSMFYCLSDEDELEEEFNQFVIDINKSLEEGNVGRYYHQIIDFIDLIYDKGAITKKRCQKILTYLSILIPSYAQYMADNKLQLKNPIDYYSWD